jgi:hypothetical protein
MNFVLDPILAVNLVLCIIILLLGYTGFKNSQNHMPFHIGIAFGLFGVTHLLGLLGYKESLEGILIIIRICAYLIVVYTLHKVAFTR